MLRHEAYHRLYFLTVARGPTISQSDRLIWPPDHIQCIDERIAVAKQRALETSNFVRYVFYARTDIRDHRRERWRDLSIVGVVLKNETKKSSKVDQFLVTRRTLHIESNLTYNVYLKLRSAIGLVISKPLNKPWLLSFSFLIVDLWLNLLFRYFY